MSIVCGTLFPLFMVTLIKLKCMFVSMSNLSKSWPQQSTLQKEDFSNPTHLKRVET